MTKLKKDCTPEEWAEIRTRAKSYDAKQRKKSGRQEYMKRYLGDYVRTEEYRQKDNSRYSSSRRERHLANFRNRTYGVTPEEVRMLMAIQGGRCAVCLRTFTVPGDENPVTQCVDHCHETRRVRGLLCRMCNTLEGFIRRLGMTPNSYLQRMEDYLESPPAQQERLG